MVSTAAIDLLENEWQAAKHLPLQNPCIVADFKLRSARVSETDCHISAIYCSFNLTIAYL